MQVGGGHSPDRRVDCLAAGTKFCTGDTGAKNIFNIPCCCRPVCTEVPLKWIQEYFGAHAGNTVVELGVISHIFSTYCPSWSVLVCVGVVFKKRKIFLSRFQSTYTAQVGVLQSLDDTDGGWTDFFLFFFICPSFQYMSKMHRPDGLFDWVGDFGPIFFTAEGLALMCFRQNTLGLGNA